MAPAAGAEVAARLGPPAPRSEERNRRQLRVTKRRATALLGAVAVVFVIASLAAGRGAWVGYVQATAEASLVGGLADWFAVTALFRRPLGLPIPHTAIIVERKEQFGRTLGDFVQDSFLTPDTIVERVAAAGLVGRGSAWLVEPANATRVAAYLADGAVAVVDAVADDDVHRTLEELIRHRLAEIDVADLAGRALAMVTADGRHHDAFEAVARSLDTYLDEHRDELRERLGPTSPWWLPGAVEDRIFERLLDGARAVLQDMAADRGHHLRRELDDRLARLAHDLRTDPGLRARGEELKRELLAQEQVSRWVASLWEDAKIQLRSQAADPASELRRRLADAVAGAGRRLITDPALARRAERGVESAARYVAGQFHGEIATLVSTTIARWDSEETARRLELLLGPDLQYIRINGTVVGGLAGLVLHAIALALH